MQWIDQTVLIVDDQSALRETLRQELRRAGCMVVGEASTSDDALEKLKEHRPDVVVMDVTLPGTQDALVAIRQMRKAHPTVKVLVTGAPSQNDRFMEALSAGAVDFLLKPFHGRAVHACLLRNT